MPGDFRIIAHRGASRSFPENTMAAFGAALAKGADGIELDVQLSRDNIPMVYHDRTLTRAGGGRRRLAGLTRRELQRLDAAFRFDGARRRHRIPTLEQVLERYGRATRWLIEIKTREGLNGAARHARLVEEVVGLVRRMRLERRVSLLCFDSRMLDVARSTRTRADLVLNLKAPPALAPGLRRKLLAVDRVSVDIRTLTRRFADGLRRIQRPLLVYTCNTEKRARQALDCGAVGIMTDRPDWLKSLRQEQG